MPDTLDPKRLATLNAAAVMTYERALSKNLSEPERLRTLYGSGFWQGDHKDRLQALVNTAQQLLVTAGSAVVLVADDRVRMAAVAAKGDEVPATGDDSLDVSYCKYVVSEKHPFGVESAESHSLVCTSRATTQRGIRAYLGVPLCAPNGMVLGSFCVWELASRLWTEVDVMVLTNLAAVAVALEVLT